MLSKREWALVAIAMAEGRALSPVQLQKTMFLIEKTLGQRDVLPENYYHFEAYNYGPFCAEIYSDVSRLASCDAVSVSRDPQYGYNLYAATQKGLEEAREAAEALDPTVREYVSNLVTWVRQQSFERLVSYIYEKYPAYRANSIFRG